MTGPSTTLGLLCTYLPFPLTSSPPSTPLARGIPPFILSHFVQFTLALIRNFLQFLLVSLERPICFSWETKSTAKAETLPGEARPGIATLAWEVAFVGGQNGLQPAGQPRVRSDYTTVFCTAHPQIGLTIS